MRGGKLTGPAALCMAALILSACATGGETIRLSESASQPVQVEGVDQLPPQVLAPGDCGVFLWGRAAPHPFLVFENRTEGLFRVWFDARGHSVAIAPRPATLGPGDRFDTRTPIAQAGVSVHVRGEISGAARNGRRIESAILAVERADGAREVTPVAGVYACRETDS